MQANFLRSRIIIACALATLLLFSGTFAVYQILRAQYSSRLEELLELEPDTPQQSAYIISGISTLLNRSYLLSDEMLGKASNKLIDCRSVGSSYTDIISASTNALLYAYAIGDDSAIISNSISLADCCLLLGSNDDAETIYSRMLVRTYKDPAESARAYAAAELGLSKVCVATGRSLEALEHVQNCLDASKLARLPEYKDYAGVVLAQIKYMNGLYNSCSKSIEALFPAQIDENNSEFLQKLTLPLLSLQSLIAAQNGEFFLAEQRTDSFMELAETHHFSATISRHLSSLKAVYAKTGQHFPEHLSDKLIESYRISSEQNIGFITDYAMMEYFNYSNKNKAFKNSFALTFIAAFIIVLLLLQAVLRLVIKSQTDPLTGLLNRGRFTRDCRAVTRRRRPTALIMLDVDDFKSINDSFGHQVGDAVLIRVAGAILKSCGRRSSVYRIGGEEFAVMCRGGRNMAPYTLAEHIRTAVEELHWREEELSVTLSAGVAIGRTCCLYKQADDKLYYSKNHGKNRIS